MKIIQALNYDEKEKTLKDFYVNSCGFIRDIDTDTGVNRENGREDYQLIFIKKGPFYAEFDGEEQIFSDNSLILFKPKVMQKYHCRKNEGAEYFWIHFDGVLADKMLKSAGIYENRFTETEIIPEYEAIVEDMVFELLRKSSYYEIRVLNLFSGLMCEIAKKVNSEGEKNSYERLKPAFISMEKEPEGQYSVSDYAEMCHLSEFYFIHKFKEATGKTPKNYKNELLMKKSVYLLANTGLSICEISERLGIYDSMYFSKKFKSFYGVSPTEYRKRKQSK